MGLTQLNDKSSNPESNKNLHYSRVELLAILFTHTKQLTSPFIISQLPQNTNESSFKHFIEHLVGLRELSKFNDKQVRLRFKQNQLVIYEHNHNQRSHFMYKSNIGILIKQRPNKLIDKPKGMKLKREREKSLALNHEI